MEERRLEDESIQGQVVETNTELTLYRHNEIVRILNESTKHHSKSKSCGSKVGSGLILICGFASGIPYFAPARKFAGTNYPLGYVYAVDELIALGTLTSWLLKDIITHIQYSRIVTPRVSCTSLSFLILPVTLGFFTSLPITVVGYIFNPTAPYLALIAFAGDIIGSTFTFNKLLRLWFSKIKNRAPDRKLYENLRDVLTYSIECAKIDISNLNNDEYQHFLKITDFNNVISNREYNPKKTLSFFKKIVFYGNSSNRMALRGGVPDKIKTYGSLSLALIMPLNWAPTAYKLVYTTGLNVIKYSSISALLAVFSATPGYLLEGLFCMEMSIGLFDIGRELVSRKSVKNYSLYYFPIIFSLMLIIGLVVAGFSFATRAQVIEETYENGIYKDITLPWVCLMICLYKAYGIVSSIPKFVEYIGEKSSNVFASSKANFVRLADGFSSIIQELEIDQLTELKSALETDSSDDAEATIDNTNEIDEFPEITTRMNNNRLSFFNEANQLDQRAPLINNASNYSETNENEHGFG